jgi:L-alanine-DL-glutamate epimerase-like enolase superfamily enzyme
LRITQVSLYRIELPYVGGTYGWAKGLSVSVAESIVIRLDTDEGVIGWGEVCPLGASYLASHAAGVPAGIGLLAPCLIGLDPTRIGEINRVMDREMRGHAYVKAPLDMACWDILGKLAGLPAHALLGGRQNDAMPMYRAVPQDRPEAMAASVEGFRAEGYRQFQLKVGGDPAVDAARIRAVVEGCRPGELVLADGNTGWRRDEALYVANETRDLHYILEQPCLAYEDCLSVRRRAGQPFKLDESLQDARDLTRALKDDACDAVSIKVAKHGGLTRARLIRDCCAANGIEMTVEDVWGGEIVSAALAHLAASTPPDYLLNTTDLHNYNSVHFAEGAPEVRDGRLQVSDRPGLGVEPDQDRLGAPIAVHA